VSIPVYTVKGLFTTCVPQFLEHATGIHPQMLGSTYVRLLLCWRMTILLSVSPCRLRSMSSSVAFRLCLSISVPRQNVWSAL